MSSAGAATSSVTVAATVASATTLNNSCTQAAGREFGLVTAGVAALTDTGAGVCRFGFSSSNDSAQLRIGTSDAFETAMSSDHVIAGTGTTPSSDHTTGTAINGTSLAYAIVASGNVLRSTDAGATWAAHGPGPLAAACAWCWVNDIAVSPSDGNRLWAVAGNDFVSRSVDGGSTWERIATPTLSGMDVVAVDVVSDSTVFVAATNWSSVRVMRTTTANAALPADVVWDIDAAVPSTAWTNGMDAVDANNVWITGAGGGKLMRSTNGGSTWDALTVPSVPNHFSDVAAVTASRIVVVGQTGRVRATSDGTAATPAWTDLPTGEQHHLRKIAAVDSSTWFVAGERGALYRTLDGGLSWTRIESAVRGHPGDISAFNGTQAVLGAEGQRLAATNDGLTWAVKDRGPAATLTAVAAVSGTRVAVAVGEEGRIRRSIDNGATYGDITSPVTAHLNDVESAQSEASALFAVGTRGTVIRSIDSGISWTATASAGTTTELLGVAAANSRIAYAVGRSGTVISTRDGGASWKTMTSPAASLLRTIGVVGTDTVVAAGDSGVIYRSTDGGSSWSTIVPPGWGYAIFSLDVVDGTSVIWAGTGWDQMLRSLDGGVTWTLQEGTGYQHYSVAAVSHDVAYFSTYSGKLGATNDGGGTWSVSGVGINGALTLWGIDAVDTTRAVAVGARLTSGRVRPGASIGDYENDNVGADTDWAAGSGVGLFGVCLQAVGASTSAVWALDTDGACVASDLDPWRSVPNGTDKAATTSGAGVSGSIDVVWGFRAASTEPPGKFAARVTIEVIAPEAP